jgi:hypothetical protein
MRQHHKVGRLAIASIVACAAVGKLSTAAFTADNPTIAPAIRPLCAYPQHASGRAFTRACRLPPLGPFSASSWRAAS